MKKNIAFFLGCLMVAGALIVLTPQEPSAQTFSCRDAYIRWWDAGYPALASPFGYMEQPVDPFSAEWSGSDCWCAGLYGYAGYAGWYDSRWGWFTPWRQERTRREGPLALDIAILRPMGLAGDRALAAASRHQSAGARHRPGSAHGKSICPNRLQPHSGAVMGQGHGHAGGGNSSGRKNR